MKRARFIVNGRYSEGTLAAPGSVIDSQGHMYAESEITFLPPVAQPGKILGLALNYADHAGELGLAIPDEPAIFFKPATALVGHRGAIVSPPRVQYMHYENELAAVIGTRCRRVREANALNHVAGYTIANDVTVRDFVTNTFRPPVKAKGWDTFLPMGPYLVVDEVADPQALEIRTYVNGTLRQSGSTADQLMCLAEFIEYVSEYMTLEPGDILLTGTPPGLSHIYPGDSLRLEITGLEALESVVISDGAAIDTEAATLIDAASD